MQFLIKAKDHWMDLLTPAQRAAFSDDEKASFDRRTVKGDIIVVKPDDHIWGKEECLPNYIVVKVPGLELDKKFEKSLKGDISYSTTGPGATKFPALKRRKFTIPSHIINNLISLEVSEITLDSNFVSNILEKTE